ncbi:hypothetical protein FZ103_10525 [Streptomonospora sp. PA3]|uniref:hypothetical protein n=1 Tax=Streptomonospora sp. PA3 TaxID=2607326 RepID=UPI0012DD138B|nr:hypothetical protein [Streptomonospora sp. PA3]MUL41605.1 hypothetical protein [Streptomonospora sp. PA3]
MRIPAVVRPETVRELGAYLDDYTYGIYRVHARRQTRRLRCNRLCKLRACTAHGCSTCPPSCPRPACTKHGPKQMWTYTVTSLINDDQTHRRSGEDPVLKTFTGENACLDAVTYLIGMLQAKAELSGARRRFVDYVHDELHRALRASGEHYANFRDQLSAGRAAMRV